MRQCTFQRMFDKLLKKLVKGKQPELDGNTVYWEATTLSKALVPDENPVDEPDAPSAEVTLLDLTFICRAAVVDCTQCVVGYEYMLHNGSAQRDQAQDVVTQQLDEQALLTRLVTMDLARLLEYRYTFITLSPQVLLRPVVERLPPDISVLLIRADSFGETIDPNLIARMAHMRMIGYGFGLVVSDRSMHFVDQLHSLIHYVVIDFSEPNPKSLLRSALEGVVHWPETQFLIRNIADDKIFSFCSKKLAERSGIHLFQGEFLTLPLPWRSDHVDAGKTRIVALLNALKQQHDTPILVECMRHDPLLLSRLLRYVNSAAINLVSKVNSVERALAVMGRESLYRWLTVLLFCSGDMSDRDMAIMDTALIRARFAETLAGNRLLPGDSDNLFLIGMFSLLDILLRVPADEALLPLDLVPEAMEALLSRSGRYACYLDLVIACEQGDQERVALYAAMCDVSEGTVNACHMEAILWAQELARM
jgi:EAL and modified HD-GYP domain-containing signal transduction protein